MTGISRSRERERNTERIRERARESSRKSDTGSDAKGESEAPWSLSSPYERVSRPGKECQAGAWCLDGLGTCRRREGQAWNWPWAA